MRTVLIAIAALFVAVGEPQAQSRDRLRLLIPKDAQEQDRFPPDPQPLEEMFPAKVRSSTQQIKFLDRKIMMKVTLAPGVILKRIYCSNRRLAFTLVNRRKERLPTFKLRIAFLDQEGDPTPKPYSWDLRGIGPHSATDYSHPMSRTCGEISKAVFTHTLK